MIDGRPECFSGRFDVTRSLTVPQPLKAARVAASAQNCENRFIIGIRPSACKIEASLCIINAVLPRTSMTANFRGPSQYANDENMVVIRGNKRVADIYFGEFMRIFARLRLGR